MPSDRGMRRMSWSRTPAVRVNHSANGEDDIRCISGTTAFTGGRPPAGGAERGERATDDEAAGLR
eukprot:gene9004-21098_t